MIDRVFLIDPSPFVQHQLGAVIQNKGMKFFSANSGKEAFNLLAKTFPDVIILEMSLPDYNGVTLLKALQKALPGTQYIVLASKLSKETLTNIIKLGIKDVFIKPFCIESLLEKMAA